MIPQIIARVILSNIQYQAVQVDHFIGHMTIRDNIIKELERTEKERIKALEEKNRAAANGQNRRTSMTSLFSKTAENLDELCQRKTEAVNSLQKTVDRMTKAMMLCEIERFNTDRIKCINQLVGSLSVTNLEVCFYYVSRKIEKFILLLLSHRLLKPPRRNGQMLLVMLVLTPVNSQNS